MSALADEEDTFSPLNDLHNGAPSNSNISSTEDQPAAELLVENPDDLRPSNEKRDRTESAQEESFPSRDRASSLHSKVSDTISTIQNMIPTNLVVTLMPWMEEERELLPHQEAAILLEYARDGQDLNGSKLTLRSRLCYRLRHKYHWFFRLAAWGLVLIHIFERPMWTYRQEHAQDWNDSKIYPSFKLAYLDNTLANSLVFVCLFFSWIGVGLELGYKRNTSNVYLPYTAVVVLIIKSVSNLVNLVVFSEDAAPAFGVSPIEGFLCLLVELQHDNNIGFLLRSIPKFCVLMIAMAVFVCIYTTLGMLIFNPEEGEGQYVFPNYGVALWNMAMVLNGANWPGPMVPSLVSNRFFVLYFYVFLILVVWGLLNIILGFNYLFFQSEQKAIADMQEATRVDNKAAAFRILDVENKGYLTYEQVDALLREMYEFYEEMTDLPSKEERYELILNLDIQSNNIIVVSDFDLIEQKCFQGALKLMRSKKRKFIRFISANFLKQQSAEILKKQTERLKTITAVGIKLDDGSGAVVTNGEQTSTGDIEDADSRAVNPMIAADTTTFANQEVAGTPRGYEAISATKKGAYQSLSLGADSTVEQSIDEAERAAMEAQVDADLEEERRGHASLIDRASAYAGKYVDPKVLAWYRQMGDSHIVKMSKERGRVFSYWMSHFAMQVDSIYFDIVSDTIIVAIGISLLLHNAPASITITYNVFTLCEMILKLTVKGWDRYTLSNRSAIDGKIAIILLILTITNGIYKHHNHSRVIIKTVVLIRTLLYPRNIIVTNGFKTFRNRQRLAFQFAFGSVDHFSFLLLVLVVMMYVFAGVGQQIFGGTIHRGSQRVAGSDYAANAFWPLNFNDMPSGMVTMFTLLSVNDMNITTSGFVAALSQWAEVFFILWYCLGVLFFLNILTAVFLNQFTGYLEQLATERRAEAEAKRLQFEEDVIASGVLSIENTPLKGDDSSKNQDPDSPDVDPFQSPPPASSVTVRKQDRRDRWADDEEEISFSTGTRATAPAPVQPGSKPEWLQDSVDEVGDTDGTSVNEPHTKGRRTSMFAAGNLKPSALLNETKELFTGATAATKHLMTDATAQATTKAAEFAHKSTTGFNTFVKMFVVDDSQGFSETDLPVQAPQTVDVHALRRASSIIPPSPSSPAPSAPHMAPSHRASRTSSASSGPGVAPRTMARRGSTEFMPLRDRAPSAEDPDADDLTIGGLAAIREDAEEEGDTIPTSPSATAAVANKVVPSSAAKSSANSIFVSDEERQQLNDWIKSKQRRKKVQVRDRRASSASHNSGNLDQPDVHRPSDDAVGESTRNPLAAADGSAVDDISVKTPDSGKSKGRRTSTSEVEMTRRGGGFTSVNQQDEESVLVDYTNQTFEQWFYDEDTLTPCEEAAALIQGALDGDDPELHTSRRGLWCFQKRTAHGNYFKICAILYSLLKFFQRPAWTFNEPHWDNHNYFPVSGLPQWSPIVTGSLKIPLLLVIMYGMSLEVAQREATFYGLWRKYTWAEFSRYMLLFYAGVQFILVVYSLSGGPQQLVAFSSCGSMLYVLWFFRKSLRKLRRVLQVAPRLGQVLLLYFTIVMLFSGFGPFLYNIKHVGADDDTSPEYFDSFRTATWSIFVAMTSSSYPCQIMPAYREYREFALFFFCFITIGALFMLNLIVAIVFVEFQKSSLLGADYQRAVRQVLLMQAFQVLDVHDQGHIEPKQASNLLAELYYSYKAFRKSGRPEGEARDALIASLDVDGDGQITEQDFMSFIDVTRAKLSTMPTQTFMEKWFPKVVEGRAFQWLKGAVKYKYTNLIFDFTIAIFTVTSLIANHKNLYRSSPSSIGLGAVQVCIMIIEAAVKLMVRGWTAYRRSFRNQLDFTITCGAFFAILGASAYDGVSGFTIMRRVLLIFRLFWLPRNTRYLFESSGIKRFAKLCWRIVGKTLTLGVVFLCILYVFASIGTFAFGGLINRDPLGPRYDELMASRYASDGYFPLNFNDFMSSLITVFAALHVSDFDVIAEGMVVTSDGRARVYFAAWYVVGVLLMLNILKSFFLDEFLNVFSSAAIADEQTKTIENGDGSAADGADADGKAANGFEEIEPLVHNPIVHSPEHGARSDGYVLASAGDVDQSPGPEHQYSYTRSVSPFSPFPFSPLPSIKETSTQDELAAEMEMDNQEVVEESVSRNLQTSGAYAADYARYGAVREDLIYQLPPEPVEHVHEHEVSSPLHISPEKPEPVFRRFGHLEMEERETVPAYENSPAVGRGSPVKSSPVTVPVSPPPSVPAPVTPPVPAPVEVPVLAAPVPVSAKAAPVKQQKPGKAAKKSQAAAQEPVAEVSVPVTAPEIPDVVAPVLVSGPAKASPVIAHHEPIAETPAEVVTTPPPVPAAVPTLVQKPEPEAPVAPAVAIVEAAAPVKVSPVVSQVKTIPVMEESEPVAVVEPEPQPEPVAAAPVVIAAPPPVPVPVPVPAVAPPAPPVPAPAMPLAVAPPAKQPKPTKPKKGKGRSGSTSPVPPPLPPVPPPSVPPPVPVAAPPLPAFSPPPLPSVPPPVVAPPQVPPPPLPATFPAMEDEADQLQQLGKEEWPAELLTMEDAEEEPVPNTDA